MTAAICQLLDQSYQLTGLIREPERITGGLLHQVWRVCTSAGDFAVKKINNSAQSSALLPLEQTQEIAAHMQQAGISTVAALANTQGKQVTLFQEAQWQVFPWLNAESIPVTQLTCKQAHKIGQLLAKMHALHLSPAAFTPPFWGVLSATEWDELLNAIQQAKIEALYFLIEQRQQLQQWSIEAQLAYLHLNQNTSLSHRDLDLRNLLWDTEDKPWLIDWDYAGPINPDLERFIVAMNSSAITVGQFNPTLFQATMQGYAVDRPISSAVISGYIGYVLDWIVLNCRWALRTSSVREPAIAEVQHSFRAIRSTLELVSENRIL